jgi:hypothetical protein
MFENADLIHRSSSTDALRDGVLIDVTATAREAVIRCPVAVTAAAWAQCVAVPAGVVCQDQVGRLWDGALVASTGHWPERRRAGSAFRRLRPQRQTELAEASADG